MQIDLGRFKDTFFEEAAEHVAGMEAALLKLETAPDDTELLNEVFRAAHSIKGGSGTFGFDGVTRFTHSLEGLLDRMREGTIRTTSALVDVILRSADALRALLAAARGLASEPNVDRLLAEIDGALVAGGGSVTAHEATRAASPAPAPAPDAGTTWNIRFLPSPLVFQQGLDPLLVLRELAEIGTVESVTADLGRLPPFAELDPVESYLAWDIRFTTKAGADRIRDVFAFVEDGAELVIKAAGQPAPAPAAPQPPAPIQAEAGPAAAPSAPNGTAAPKPPVAAASHAVGHETASIRVSVDKLDKLINLVGELVIAQSMVTDVVTNFSNEKLARLTEAVAQMERNTRDIQERVMAVRMVPVGSVFSRFPRVVRDLAAVLDKKVTLVTTGEETELDKGVVERIGDPLTHLIRNALDHGIESPAERLRAGKSEEGTISLSAYTQGGTVVIEVGDDGGGLDTERIRRKGLERGLIRPEEQLTDDQVNALIFQPAFSTAEKVTNVSGRGVGMDVVKRNVEELNGTVSIETKRGAGSRFIIRLPLTLAIMDGLTLAVGDEVFVLPLVSIVESLRPKPEQLCTVFGKGEIVMIRGEPRALVRLHRVLGVPSKRTNPLEALVVIVEHGGRQVAMLVDELLGQQQVVIKNLDTNFRRVEGVMGATIMGDGRVALILDVPGLVRIAEAKPATNSLELVSPQHSG